MKQIALALIASVASLTVIGQNLVPNPSFEEYLECPQSTTELHLQVVDWYSWQETPDYFNVCNNDGLGTAGVPENAWGYQLPIGGNAYAGIGTYVEFAPDIREYMAAPLESPLIIGNSYYMMFHASMYDSGVKEQRWCATNNIGMRFFKDPTYDPFPPVWNPLEPDNFAHINYSEILDDYTNWTLIEGWFTADDTYNWVAIGNFFTGTQTDIVILNDEGSCSGIYYIENVCVAPTPEECEYLLSTTANRPMSNISVYPNPTKETARVSLPDQHTYQLYMYDIQGRMVMYVQNIRSGQEINVSKFQKGVYVVKAFNNQAFYTFKLIKQ